MCYSPSSMIRSIPWASSTPGLVAVALVLSTNLVACEGTKETVHTLRAEHVEIVDDKGAPQIDVAARIRALEDRARRLEEALERRGGEGRAGAPPAPGGAPDEPESSRLRDAGATHEAGSRRPPAPEPTSPWRAGPRSGASASSAPSHPEIF